MSSILDTRVYGGGNVDSHHRLVIMSIQLRLCKKPKEKRGRRFDMKPLQDVSIKADGRTRTTTGLNVRDSITTEPQHYKDQLITSMHRKQGQTSKDNTKHATP